MPYKIIWKIQHLWLSKLCRILRKLTFIYDTHKIAYALLDLQNISTREMSHKRFIFLAFLATRTITRCENFSGSITKILGGLCENIFWLVYIKVSQAVFIVLTVARTCKYEFPVFTRFRLCNALSQREYEVREVQNDDETSTNTRMGEQGLYRRVDRSGFAAEPRINRRRGKADMRSFAYDHPSRISDVSPAHDRICSEKISGKTRLISRRNTIPVLSSAKTLRLEKKCKVTEMPFIYVCAWEGRNSHLIYLLSNIVYILGIVEIFHNSVGK